MKKMYKSKKELRRAWLLFSFIFTCLFIILPRLSGHQPNLIAFYLVITITSLAILKPYSLSYPYSVWIEFGNKLGRLNSNLILIIFFIFMIIPVSLIIKIFNCIKLILYKNKRNSYYKDVNSMIEYNFCDQV